MRLALLVAVAACGRHSHRAHEHPAPTRTAPPEINVADVDPASLCVTAGKLAEHRVEVPTFRAVAPGHSGDGALLEVAVRGDSDSSRALAGGQDRRQLGLKLRAADGCNLLYVMWRLDPKPAVEVSIKRNPDAHTSKECGANGYTKIEPDGALVPPPLVDGAPHTLQAELSGTTLTAWIDGRVTWQGQVDAHDLAGPAGIRSDNLAFEIRRLAVDGRPGQTICNDDP